jgi:DNA-binding response OmpR family regulator
MDSFSIDSYEKHRVLVVDQERYLRQRYEILLASHGYDVRTAASGLDCLDKLRWFAPDVLILDLHVLWGGGEGVLAAMRDDGCLEQVPVLLTMMASSEIVTGIRSPMVEPLIKPFSPMLLLAKVRDAARTRGRRLKASALHPLPRPHRLDSRLGI